MLYNGVLLRKEIKYLLNYSEYLVIVNIIKGIAKYDHNAGKEGKYSVESLYFDDIYNLAYIDKKIGMKNTYKFRLRCYNHNADNIKLEKKYKLGDYGGKDSIFISYEKYKHILSRNILPIDVESSNLQKAFYVDSTTKLLKPKLVISYMREAFTMSFGNENIRITLDNNVKWSVDSLDMLNEKALFLDAFKENKYILEIKYHNYLPEIISDALCLLDRFPQGLSKYQLCRRQKEDLLQKGIYG
jgi:hypothetical protein